MRPARTLHVIDTLDQRSGGPVACLMALADRSAQSNTLLEVVSLDLPDAECVNFFPAPAHGLGEANGLARYLAKYRYSSKLVPWLKEHARQYECVVLHGIWNFHAVAAGHILQRLQVPYVVFPHGMLDPWFRRAYPLKHIKKQIYWSLLLGKVFSGARAVLFTAEAEKLLARGAFRGYPNDRERVIRFGPNDVPPATEGQIVAFRNTLPALGDRRFLLFLGRIDPKKGCDLLINAFARIAPAWPQLDLVMAGPDSKGWTKDLQGLAQRQEVADRVHWPGMLSGDAKWGAFRAADAFILPSHQENFGIAVAESMACATPVLISQQVNIWREVVAAGAGLAAADDLPGTVGLIEKFLQQTAAERGNMTTSARVCFLSRFNGDGFAEDMRQLVFEMRQAGRP